MARKLYTYSPDGQLATRRPGAGYSRQTDNDYSHACISRREDGTWAPVSFHRNLALATQRAARYNSTSRGSDKLLVVPVLDAPVDNPEATPASDPQEGNMASKTKSTSTRHQRPVLKTKREKQARMKELEGIMASLVGDYKLYQVKRSEANSTDKAEAAKAAKARDGLKANYSAYKRAYMEHIALRKDLGIAVRASTRNGATAQAQPEPTKKATRKRQPARAKSQPVEEPLVEETTEEVAS